MQFHGYKFTAVRTANLSSSDDMSTKLPTLAVTRRLFGWARNLYHKTAYRRSSAEAFRFSEILEKLPLARTSNPWSHTVPFRPWHTELNTFEVLRSTFGCGVKTAHEKSIKSSGQEIKSRLAWWCAGVIDTLQIIPYGHSSSRNSNTCW